MGTLTPYEDFTARLKLFVRKHPELITIALSNIFTMRLIGNKTHGDLAEIGIAEFVNQYMYDFRSVHVGKDLYRAKSQEEDITIINELTHEEFPVSLKAYGDGPLQLSTDKTFAMFRRLEQAGSTIEGRERILGLLDDPAFTAFSNINVLPLIYDEKAQRCNILVFDYARVREATVKIVRLDAGHGRKHPVYRFHGDKGEYICEVRYGDAAANALQRGLWTHTRNALEYFDSITNGWIEYSHNLTLVRMLSKALVCSEAGHAFALQRIEEDIALLKQHVGISKEIRP